MRNRVKTFPCQLVLNFFKYPLVRSKPLFLEGKGEIKFHARFFPNKQFLSYRVILFVEQLCCGAINLQKKTQLGKDC